MELAKKITVKTSEESYTTASGVKARQISLSVEGDKALVWVPAQVKERTRITLVIHCHGYTGTERDLLTEPGDPLSHHLSKGWVVVAGYNLGNSGWGRREVMEIIRAQYEWVAARYMVENVLLTGGSMGGFTALNVYQNDVVPNIKAAALVVSVINLSAMTEDGQTYPTLQSWGVTSNAELEAKQKSLGLDPLRDDPHKMAGKPLFLHQDLQDPIVRKQKHGDIFMARAATPEAITYRITDGTRHDYPFRNDVIYPKPKPDWVFLAKHAPAYDSSQDPAPTTPPSGASLPAYSSGAFTPDGTAVALYTTSGELVAIRKTEDA